MALVIAGERSGSGKTTTTLALLASLRRGRAIAHIRLDAQAISVQSFKVGPDYIDPMFHQFVTGRPCRNLDPVLTSESYVQDCFATHALRANYSLTEGVMGLFDGATLEDDWGSTAHIARLLDLPILLVLDCSRLSGSVAALAKGYQSLDPRLQIAGVVLNRVGSDRHLDFLKSALARIQMPVLGVLRRQDDITIPDRHLGLVPTDELPELRILIDRLAEVGDRSFNWSALLPLLQSSPAQASIMATQNCQVVSGSVRIAIARDAAFNFYYADNLELLERCGAELVYWSPLQDPLPPNVQGLYFGGGFPEIFAATLSANQPALGAVRAAIQAGIPTYAECGGLMYLCEAIQDLQGQSFPMVGVLPTTVTMQPRLTLGYRQATAQRHSPLVTQGQCVWGHEFHHSQTTPIPSEPLFITNRFRQAQPIQSEGWCVQNVHASYVHLHWGTQPEIPQRFVQHCANWTMV
ncbi:cobyrinate a,c-diamide synthase [Synechococcales cyanobacterium C]|uniref:Cobyrinate a,c-diamide synthase n=1 Tax=Petrachloros mirabilis ULC683 TaxID=2781853 RepID=A0A8K2A6Z3_9CYAN|nr:cobyrinate a,c-diamide synthase [Petrachloros mirabilis]NCJ06439.1 cobyrinate a,c-diamide synthase [Petrachloros mirabilis ULC683]